MELYDAMRSTHAARKLFRGSRVPDKVLNGSSTTSGSRPAGGNRQGTRVIVVRDTATRGVLAELSSRRAPCSVAQTKAGQSPWNPLQPPAPTAAEIAETRVPAPFTEPLRTAGAVLIFLVDLGVVAAMDQDLDQVGLVAGASVYPLVWNVLLNAARSEGTAGPSPRWRSPQEPAVRELLGVPDEFALAAVEPAAQGRRRSPPGSKSREVEGVRDPRDLHRRALPRLTAESAVRFRVEPKTGS